MMVSESQQWCSCQIFQIFKAMCGSGKLFLMIGILLSFKTDLQKAAVDRFVGIVAS